MKAETMRWWMEVLRKGVYTILGVGAIGFLTFGLALMLKSLEYRVFLTIFGLVLGIFGVALCFLSGVAYDRLNAKLRIAESIEKKEAKKEEKHARKPKTHKTDRS